MMGSESTRKVTKILSTFKCRQNPDSELFLKNTARLHDSKDISKTYLWLDENHSVVGFFTLAVKCLVVKEGTDETICESMNVDNGIAQAYLIGQIARSDTSDKGLGKRMIISAMKILSSVKGSVGCRVIRLDCQDDLIRYYASLGFRRIGYNEKKDLNQMAMVM